MRWLANPKHWEGYNPPDPEGESALAGMLRRAAHRRQCCMGRHRGKNGEICPCAERCQDCGDERMAGWQRQFWKLEKAASWALKQPDPVLAMKVIRLVMLYKSL